MIRFLILERIIDTSIIGICTSAVMSVAEPVIRITFWKTKVSSKNILIMLSGQQGLLNFEISCSLYRKISYSYSWYWGKSSIVKVTNWCIYICLYSLLSLSPMKVSNLSLNTTAITLSKVSILLYFWHFQPYYEELLLSIATKAFSK